MQYQPLVAQISYHKYFSITNYTKFTIYLKAGISLLESLKNEYNLITTI